MKTAAVRGRQQRRTSARWVAAAATVAALAMTEESAAQVCRPGNIEWIRQFGTAASDESSNVAVDMNRNVYVVGNTGGALAGQTSAGGVDAFLRKYDSAGNELWTRQFGTAGDDAARDVTVDRIGNAYVAASVSSSGGSRRALVRKYDTNGSELWSREFGGLLTDASGVVVDAAGDVYVAGAVFGVLPGQISAGNLDAFVRKYDFSGNVIWTRQFGTAGIDGAADVAVDPAGDVYVSGSVGGALPGQSSAGGRDAFVREYDSAGTEIWTSQFGTSGDDAATGVAVDAAANAYVTGGVADALPGQIWLGGLYDAFLRKYDAAGSELWTRQFGTALGCPGCFGFDLAFGVAVDDAGDAYVAGTVGGRLSNQVYAGGGDAFVRVYDAAGGEIFTRQFGSPFSDDARGVAVDDGSIYVAGVTFGVVEGQNQGFNWDGFAARIFKRDVEPPSLTVVPSADTLWPPDHRLEQVNMSFQVSDACDSSSIVTLLSVTSNEPDNGIADGDTEDDIQIVDPNTVMLRAERSAVGSGRVYTASYVATDASGNSSVPVSVTVAVPLK